MAPQTFWPKLLKFKCLAVNLPNTINQTFPLAHAYCVKLGSIVIYYLSPLHHPFSHAYPNGLVWLKLLKFTARCLAVNLPTTNNLTFQVVHVHSIMLSSIVIYYLLSLHYPFSYAYPNGLVWLKLLKFTASCQIITTNLTFPLRNVHSIMLVSIVIYYLTKL